MSDTFDITFTDLWDTVGDDFVPEVLEWIEEHKLSVTLVTEWTGQYHRIAARCENDKSATLFKLRWL